MKEQGQGVDPGEDALWVPLAEAARRLQRNERTVREWLKDGRIRGRKVEERGSLSWRVYVGDGAPDLPPSDPRWQPLAGTTAPPPGMDPGQGYDRGEEQGREQEQGQGAPVGQGQEVAPPAPDPAPFPTRDDILALIREQLTAERAEKETLRQENQAACRRIGTLEQALRDQLPALAARHAETHGEIAALGLKVAQIDTRGQRLARQGRVAWLTSVVLALVAAALSGMLLTARSLTPTDRARGSDRGSAPATQRAEPSRGSTRPAAGSAPSTDRTLRTPAKGPGRGGQAIGHPAPPP